jgi:hypothetical protein
MAWGMSPEDATANYSLKPCNCTADEQRTGNQLALALV